MSPEPSMEIRKHELPRQPIPGIHHVTAIAGDPQTNIDFYAGVLGLRLVKKTVNFDDPGTYHFYYGDAGGDPGSILTFFPWAGARRGRAGAGQTTATAFAVRPESLEFWRRRLDSSASTSELGQRFGDPVLRFQDPDGLGLELVGSVVDGDSRRPWDGSGIPIEHAIRGFDAITLTHHDSGASADLLLGTMGFREVGQEGPRRRFESGEGGSGTRVDLLESPTSVRGLGGAGTVHHVAFRNVDDASQAEWREHLASHLLGPTEVKDRNYFHSIYFREPGGVLFEMATDPPGFAADESPESLGTDLKLPSWLEPARDRIEAVLPSIELPIPGAAILSAAVPGAAIPGATDAGASGRGAMPAPDARPEAKTGSEKEASQ